jgi:hypothetical protein
VDVDEERCEVGTIMRLEDLNKPHLVIRAATQALEHLGSHCFATLGWTQERQRERASAKEPRQPCIFLLAHLIHPSYPPGSLSTQTASPMLTVLCD